MTATLKSVVDFLIYPMNVFWILIVFYFIFKFRKYKHQNRFLYAALVWIGIIGTKYIPDLMVYSLEKKYSTLNLDFDSLGNEVHILVLGGGGVYDIEIADQERLSQNSLARLNEGIRIYKDLKGAKLVFSGYSSTNNVTQAAITRDAAIGLGIPEDDIFILEKPSTTEEEALEYTSAFGNKKVTLILVTSDIHMPRSMYLFRKHGLDPIAAPSDHILKRHFQKDKMVTNHENSFLSIFKDNFWWRSHRSNFDKFYLAMHEHMGLIWAKM